MKRCPWAFCGEDALFACDLLPVLEAGVLPDPGGLMDQAAVLVDAVMLASSERSIYLDRERAEFEQRQRDAQAAGGMRRGRSKA